MMDLLINYIRRHSRTPLSEAETVLISETFIPKKLRKRQFFLQEGDVCKNFGFITSGALRQYTVDDRGQEHIIGLAIENWWSGDRESYFKEQPSIYNIDAWEDTELLLLPRKSFDQLCGIPAFDEMRLQMDHNYSVATQKRLLGAISHSAEKRYADLMAQYPEFLQRFPQHIIASYLGVTKETLSRIRNQSVKK